MKKTLLFVLMAVLGIGISSARDRYSRNVADLPTAALSFINNNFKAKVSLIKIDKETFGGTDYEVVLTDGSEIDFDSKGNWKDIEVPAGKGISDKIVPSLTQQYIKTNHRGQRVVGMERERHGYSIQLTNGIEFKTDPSGRFLRYDD